MAKSRKIVWAILAVLVGASVLIWMLVWRLDKTRNLEVIFFDVGQGDSIFIETPEGFQVLIDGGPDLTILDKLGKEMAFYDRTIDLVVLTHPDHDHIFGLLEVLKRYQIKNVLWTGVVKDTAEWKEWQRLIKEEGAEIIIAQAGQRIIYSSDIFFNILFPFENLEGQEVEDSNNASVVLKLVFRDKAFLFTGDISQKIEEQLTDLNADILKVAHHGSKVSTGLEFLQAVSPEIAIISVGENQWGHPAQETLKNLEQSGIKVLITKELGDIAFSCRRTLKDSLKCSLSTSL